MSQPWDKEDPITAYAIRTDADVGWIVDGMRAPLADIELWWRKARGRIVELRQIGEPFRGFDPPSWSRHRAREAGWWYDLASCCWRAPDEFIEPPAAPSLESEGLACAFHLPEAGWMRLTLARGDRSAAVDCSSVFDPIPSLLRWLTDISALLHPRMAINEENGSVELHVIPATLPKKHYTRYDERSPRVRFLVVADRDRPHGDVLLDVTTTHRILVASIYCAYRGVIKLAPQRFHTEWHRFVADPDLDEFEILKAGYPLRSPELERWLWGREEE